ncbi:hypothetical protein PENARI_c018G10464 [Penicillium arizonense]|uniref:Uncharacterized protein n=1 Tax=Penicillium arizonense TaxID=1835702 RepID=A0A1F5LA16_PENAI|nr:hypothetical protein PENARI_c018G10464 [Penicillium arizonense]OGE50078.1 hypothetical protein PENARI_c018G10464 [Penicillium arizonense]
MADTPNRDDALIRENIQERGNIQSHEDVQSGEDTTSRDDTVNGMDSPIQAGLQSHEATPIQVDFQSHEATQSHADTQHNEDAQGHQDARNQEQTEIKGDILRNETEQMSPHSPIPPLFTLPLELRHMIWRQLIPRGLSIEVSRRFRPFGVEPLVSTYDWDAEDLFGNQIPRWTGILTICKQMSEECLDILYGENLFEIWVADDAEISMKRFFGKANLRRLRYVVAISHTASGFDKGTPKPDRHFWETILPGLTDFSWRMEAPSSALDDEYLPDEKIQGMWREWTDTLLTCFSMGLRGRTDVDLGYEVGYPTERVVRIKRHSIEFRRGPFVAKRK